MHKLITSCYRPTVDVFAVIKKYTDLDALLLLNMYSKTKFVKTQTTSIVFYFARITGMCIALH